MSGFLADADLSANRIELARQRAAQRGYIDLTSSNPTQQGLLFPPDVLRAAADPYWPTRRYTPDPRGLLPARQAVVDYYAQRTPGFKLDIESVFLTASTSEAYGLLFALLAEPGDNILAPDVTYPLFEYLAAIYHVELRPYRLDESRHWQIDPTSVYAQTDSHTRGILIISPHNPTGMIVQSPVAALDDLGLPIICDEVFAEFTYRAPHTPPIATLHPRLPVFHLNGISKLFALPDLKLGWIALNEPAAAEYAARLELLNDTFLGANSLTQSMLPALFAQGAGFVTHMHTQIQDHLDMALEMLAQCPAIQAQPPDGGYYLFPEVQGWDSEDDLVLYLLDKGVLVHPGYFYGYERGVHIMISALTEQEKLKAGLQILIDALNTSHHR
jgi:aspartate/methionine/tyrosine aminotransferase